MGSQTHLTELVDLALCNPEVGAVNFNHLKTLLLAIIDGSSTNEKNDVVAQATDVETDQEDGINDQQIKQRDSGININQKNEQDKLSDKLSDKLQSVLSSQKKLEERIDSLENDLNSYAKFPSNDQILRHSSIDEEPDESSVQSDSASGKRASSAADVLAPTWQNMKTKKRLETVEDAIEKLFSLINDLLARSKNEQVDDEILKKLRTDLNELSTNCDAEHQKLHGLHDNLEERHTKMLEDLKRLQEDVNSMKSNIEQNQAGVNSNGIEANSKAIQDLMKDVESVTKSLDESTNDSDKTSIGEESEKLIGGDQLDDINKRIDDLTAKLDSKSDTTIVDGLSDSLSSLDKRVDDFMSSTQDELNRLKESMSNLDNAEVKELLASMDDLRKMASQIEDLRKLNDLKDLADNVESLKDLKAELDRLKENQGEFSFDDFMKKQKEFEEELNEMKKNSIHNPDEENNMSAFAEELKNLKNSYENLSSMLNDLRNSSSGESDNKMQGLDPSLIAAIQHLAQQNRQQIAALQAELNLLKKLQHQPPTTTTTNTQQQDGNNNIDATMLDKLHSHVAVLQEEQVKVAGQFANMLDDTKDEFMRKQQHIDALYDYIDKLQNNKADKEDITSGMDVKADKQALDSKVNMSTFDERYQMLEQALQHALNRLDEFVEKETTLSNALDKLHTDLDTKMDSDAEKKLKKFLDDRLKEIQKSRNNLQPMEHHDHDVIMDMRNAAGLRKPMPLSYHCISCDRPVDVSLRGVMGSIPQNFPAKKSMAPYTSYELDHLRNNPKKILQPSIERMNGGRQCGGQHTTVNSTMYRTQKNHTYSNDFVDAYEKNVEQEDSSIIDCVVGKDGQIYRGRFKSNQYIQPIPKRAVPPNPRTKHHLHKHRYTHSANTPTATNKDIELIPLRDEGRASSANVPLKERDENGTPPSPAKNGSPVAQTVNRDKQRNSRNNSPVSSSREKQRSSPVSLPPISRDGSLVGEDLTNGDV